MLVDFVSWNPKSLALEFNDCNRKSITWNPECPVWTPESKSGLSCGFFLLVQFNRVLRRLEITTFRARTLDRLFNEMAIFMWIVSTVATVMDTRIKYQCIYCKGKK